MTDLMLADLVGMDVHGLAKLVHDRIGSADGLSLVILGDFAGYGVVHQGNYIVVKEGAGIFSRQYESTGPLYCFKHPTQEVQIWNTPEQKAPYCPQCQDYHSKTG